MDNDTTIKLRRNTKSKLTRLKIHPRQTYDEVILNLLSAMPGKVKEELNPADKKAGDALKNREK